MEMVVSILANNVTCTTLQEYGKDEIDTLSEYVMNSLPMLELSEYHIFDQYLSMNLHFTAPDREFLKHSLLAGKYSEGYSFPFNFTMGGIFIYVISSIAYDT